MAIKWDEYRIEHKDHIHALGVIVSTYNSLEFTLFFFFCRYHQIRPPIGQSIFAGLNNYQRVNFTRNKLNESNEDDRSKGWVNHFLSAYDIVTENKNFLVHSSVIINTTEQEHITFGKGSKTQPNNWSFAHMTVDDLRKVAEEIGTLHEFGTAVQAWLEARETGGSFRLQGKAVWTPPLPETPPLPDRLKNVPDGVLQ